jgi:type I restriction enzyme R subunit
VDRDKLGSLLALKYHTVVDAAAELGSVEVIRSTFIGFQPRLFGGEPV